MRLLLGANLCLLGAKSMPFGCMSMARLGAKYAEVGRKSMDTFGCMYAAFGCMSMARLGACMRLLGACLTVGSFPHPPSWAPMGPRGLGPYVNIMCIIHISNRQFNSIHSMI